MNVRCQKCSKVYDDLYRLTFCPHKEFDMLTIIMKDDKIQIVTNVEELKEIMK